MTKPEVPFTNASELARLAGVTRQALTPHLADGTIEAVRVHIGSRSAWRVKTTEADRWLKARGVKPPRQWVPRVGVVGAMEDCWVAE